MSDQERPAEFTVTITEQQRQTVLSGLANERVDAKRYLSGPAPRETPGPLDSCCEGHLARWRDQVDLRQRLEAKLQSVDSAVEKFLYDGEVF